MPTVETTSSKQLIIITDHLIEDDSRFTIEIYASTTGVSHVVHIYKTENTEGIELNSLASVDKLITFLEYIKKTWEKAGWIKDDEATENAAR